VHTPEGLPLPPNTLAELQRDKQGRVWPRAKPLYPAGDDMRRRPEALNCRSTALEPG